MRSSGTKMFGIELNEIHFVWRDRNYCFNVKFIWINLFFKWKKNISWLQKNHKRYFHRKKQQFFCHWNFQDKNFIQQNTITIFYNQFSLFNSFHNQTSNLSWLHITHLRLWFQPFLIAIRLFHTKWLHSLTLICLINRDNKAANQQNSLKNKHFDFI